MDMDDQDKTDEDAKYKRERENTRDHENPGPFKKAKFAWQIKGDKSKEKPFDPSVDSNEQSSIDQSKGKKTDHANTEQCEGPASVSDIESESLHHIFDCSNSSLKHDRVVMKNLEDSNEISGEIDNAVIEIERRGLRQTSEELPDISSAYWRRRAPFDVLRTTVTIAANSDCLPALRQREELGCAIVDNVFNRTLEEIGISPDQKGNRGMMRIIERALENHGIETAISHQGLQIQGHENQMCVNSETVDSTEGITDSDNISEGNVDDVCLSIPVQCPSSTTSERCDGRASGSPKTSPVTGAYGTQPVGTLSNSGVSCSNKFPTHVESHSGENTEIVLDLAVSAAIHTRGINMTRPQT